MKECLFCNIINNMIPSKTLYEDDVVKVFLDVSPLNPGHTLIIPKKHILDITQLDNDTHSHIHKTAKQMYKILTEKLKCDGVKLVQNNGICQEIKHYHLHLIPIYKNKPNLNIDEVYDILNK